MKTTFDVKYYWGGKFSHKYQETWEKLDLYCPSCGAPTVFAECSGGDYYVGEQYLCLTCSSQFFLPNGVGASDSDQDRQRIEHIRADIEERGV